MTDSNAFQVTMPDGTVVTLLSLELAAEPENNDKSINDDLAEAEMYYSRPSTNGFCPACGAEVEHYEQELDDELVECTDYCHHCGWESDPYYA